MQGLIAGASRRADPGSSSGDAGGNNGTGLGHPLPGSPSSFQSFGQGSRGLLWGLTQPLWVPQRRQPGK